MRSIIVNNPRTSYFVGGSEMVSMQHAKSIQQLGYDVTFTTINPESINKAYSEQYKLFKRKYYSDIHFEELAQDPKALFIYDIEPGEDRSRWNTEALFYNRRLFNYLTKSKTSYDAMLSYFNIDALVIPSEKVSNNIIYLSGIPKDESIFRHSFLSAYDKLFAITNETKDYWQKYAQHPISVVYTGVDTDRFKPGERERNSKLTVLFVGRLIERKGCDVLLGAIAAMPKNILNDVCVNIVGDGPQRNKLESMAFDLGISKRVNFLGSVSNPEHYMSSADICAFPSLRGEGLQGVVLEAMACGLSVIAGDTEMNIELLGEGRGLAIDSSRIEFLRDGLINLIESPDLRKQMGGASRKYVLEHFNWNKLTQDILREVL